MAKLTNVPKIKRGNNWESIIPKAATASQAGVVFLSDMTGAQGCNDKINQSTVLNYNAVDGMVAVTPAGVKNAIKDALADGGDIKAAINSVTPSISGVVKKIKCDDQTTIEPDDSGVADLSGKFSAINTSINDSVQKITALESSRLNSATGSDTIDFTVTGTSITGIVKSGSITSSHIANGTIVADDIASNAVTSVKIFNGAVGTDKIADNAVTSAKIAKGAVTPDDLNADSGIVQIGSSENRTNGNLDDSVKIYIDGKDGGNTQWTNLFSIMYPVSSVYWTTDGDAEDKLSASFGGVWKSSGGSVVIGNIRAYAYYRDEDE